MRRVFCLAVLVLTASAANADLPRSGEPAARITTKPVDQFVGCFVAAQDRASLPWWFVPKPNGGGTFSNLGAKGVRDPYFLDVADKGAKREIRLRAATANFAGEGSVLRAVDGCI